MNHCFNRMRKFGLEMDVTRKPRKLAVFGRLLIGAAVLLPLPLTAGCGGSADNSVVEPEKAVPFPGLKEDAKGKGPAAGQSGKAGK